MTHYKIKKMVETISQETYYEGTEQKSGILYSDVKQVNFLPLDNGIIVYNEIGVKETIVDDIIGEQVIYRPLDNRAIKYTDEEMKSLLDATGDFFNSNDSNLLLAEMLKFSDTIIMDDITNNPGNYFGISVDKWQTV